MARWLGLVLALGLVGGSAEAQVFKPKGKKTDVGAKAPQKKAAKKAPKAKKKSAKKKSAAADRSRPNDLTPEPSSKEDQDYVKITDDEDIE